MDVCHLWEPGKDHRLLARISLSDSRELAYFVWFGPAGTVLEELVKVVWTRWVLEKC